MNWKAFTCFETLENGITVVCAWNGHDPLDSRKRALLIEFENRDVLSGAGAIITAYFSNNRA
jgi:hypothetical protein